MQTQIAVFIHREAFIIMSTSSVKFCIPVHRSTFSLQQTIPDLEHYVAGFIINGRFDKGQFVAIRILRAIYTFFPNLLRELFFRRFDIITFCKKSRLISKGKEHLHSAFNAFSFQQFNHFSSNPLCFTFRINS